MLSVGVGFFQDPTCHLLDDGVLEGFLGGLVECFVEGSEEPHEAPIGEGSDDYDASEKGEWVHIVHCRIRERAKEGVKRTE